MAQRVKRSADQFHRVDSAPALGSLNGNQNRSRGDLLKSLLASRRTLLLLLATLAAGAILWPVPSDDLAMIFRGFLIPWISASTVAGLVGQFLLRENVVRTAALVALGFCCAVMARVIVESIPDPTLHNLWPFEVAIAAGVGVGGGLAGATVGLVIGLAVRES